MSTLVIHQAFWEIWWVYIYIYSIGTSTSEVPWLRWLGDCWATVGRTCIYIYIMCIYIPWEPWTYEFVGRESKTLTCIYIYIVYLVWIIRLMFLELLIPSCIIYPSSPFGCEIVGVAFHELSRGNLRHLWAWSRWSSSPLSMVPSSLWLVCQCQPQYTSIFKYPYPMSWNASWLIAFP